MFDGNFVFLSLQIGNVASEFKLCKLTGKIQRSLNGDLSRILKSLLFFLADHVFIPGTIEKTVREALHVEYLGDSIRWDHLF